MRQYHDLLQRVLTKGVRKDDRTGTPAVFGHRMRLNLSEGFLLVTTKTLHLKSTLNTADVVLGVRFVSGIAAPFNDWLSRHARACPEQRAA